MNEILAGFQMTPQQKEMMKGVRWLVNDGPRGSGRTFVLAMCFVQKALACGCRIPIWDHHCHPNHKERLVAEIRKIVSHLDGHELKVYGRPRESGQIQIEINYKVGSEKIFEEDIEWLWKR